MSIFWSLFMAAPLIALGGLLLFAPAKSSSLAARFFVSRKAALILTLIAWFWTAFELDTIGIDVFDAVLKLFPGELWILAAVLSFLTYIWMAPHLPVRALTAVLMLFPAELFKVTRLLTPVSGFAPVHILVASAYLFAVIGMYGMFYPWRLEKAWNWVSRNKEQGTRNKCCGIVLLVWGMAILIAGVMI